MCQSRRGWGQWCFNRRGDSLGGAAPFPPFCPQPTPVSIAGAILWGVLQSSRRAALPQRGRFNRRGDSLGGAAGCAAHSHASAGSFNRRGDSLGGAALPQWLKISSNKVSIAGAILWGVLRNDSTYYIDMYSVSIAGAILWGVLPNPHTAIHLRMVCFNRRGDSLGGAAKFEVVVSTV